jgi:hypothetical protein
MVIKSRILEWAWHLVRMNGMKNASKYLPRNQAGKSKRRRNSCRWECLIKIGPQEMVRKIWTGYKLPKIEQYWTLMKKVNGPTGFKTDCNSLIKLVTLSSYKISLLREDSHLVNLIKVHSCMSPHISHNKKYRPYIWNYSQQFSLSIWYFYPRLFYVNRPFEIWRSSE